MSLMFNSFCDFLLIFSQTVHNTELPLLDDVLCVQVRNAELAWREAKRQLRKDHRWELAELLDREEKEKLFNQHIEQLAKKKKEKFR
jgi:transcription elongation regulator 1